MNGNHGCQIKTFCILGSWNHRAFQKIREQFGAHLVNLWTIRPGPTTTCRQGVDHAFPFCKLMQQWLQDRMIVCVLWHLWRRVWIIEYIYMKWLALIWILTSYGMVATTSRLSRCHYRGTLTDGTEFDSSWLGYMDDVIHVFLATEDINKFAKKAWYFMYFLALWGNNWICGSEIFESA